MMTQRSSRMSSGVGKNAPLPRVRRNPSAGFRRRNPYRSENPFGRLSRRAVFVLPTVRERASARERGKPSRRRTERPSMRNHARPFGNALSRRTAGISALSARRAQATLGRRRNPRFASALKLYVPREIPIARRDEPLPLRILLRSGKTLRLRRGRARAVQKPHILTDARPDGPVRGRTAVVLFGNRGETGRKNEFGNARIRSCRTSQAAGSVRKLRKNQRVRSSERTLEGGVFKRSGTLRHRRGRPFRALLTGARPDSKSRPYHRRPRGFGYGRGRTRRGSGGIPAKITAAARRIAEKKRSRRRGRFRIFPITRFRF